VVAVQGGGGESSSDDGPGRSAVRCNSDEWGTGYRDQCRRGTSVERDCSTSGCDIRRSHRSAVLLL